jgi:hypothetical protein
MENAMARFHLTSTALRLARTALVIQPLAPVVPYLSVVLSFWITPLVAR